MSCRNGASSVHVPIFSSPLSHPFLPSYLRLPPWDAPSLPSLHLPSLWDPLCVRWIMSVSGDRRVHDREIPPKSLRAARRGQVRCRGRHFRPRPARRSLFHPRYVPPPLLLLVVASPCLAPSRRPSRPFSLSLVRCSCCPPIAAAGDKKAGTVGQVLKAGYKLKDRVLRPAQVRPLPPPSFFVSRFPRDTHFYVPSLAGGGRGVGRCTYCEEWAIAGDVVWGLMALWAAVACGSPW